MIRALLAAFIGTAAMTISSTTEMQWTERPPSVVPGLATAKLLRPLGVREVKGRVLDVLATWTHWGYGTLWGFVFWALVEPASLPLSLAGPLFFLIVWGAEQVHLPLLGLAPWSWKWGLKANLIDAWHHIVYAGATVAGWVLIGVAA